MAIIKPFKGIRPPQDLVEQVASRPYDVLNSAEARAEAEGNEKSLYHIINRNRIFPSVRMNMTNVFIGKLQRTFVCSKRKAGWCKMIKKTITSMPRP